MKSNFLVLTILAFLANPLAARAAPPSPARDNAVTCATDAPALAHTAYIPDEHEDCCDSNGKCAQFLSTQMLVQPEANGHT